MLVADDVAFFLAQQPAHHEALVASRRPSRHNGLVK
jgi:hypothetical protein